MKSLFTAWTFSILAISGVASAGDLVIFHSSHEEGLMTTFRNDYLPEIIASAERLNVNVRVVDVAESGAPEEIGLLPSLVYQDHKGRSVFQGRYSEIRRFEGFLRTAKRIPQGDEELVKKGVPVMELGRAAVGSPVKITNPGGSPGEDFDMADFQKAARAGLAEGFQDYSFKDTYSFGRSDRLFYMDFYPHITDTGELYIGLALFSQFNCHEPVYTDYEGTVWGYLDEVEDTFADAAELMEAEVKRQLRESTLGDGFVPLNADTQTVTWESLDLPLPEAPEGATMEIAADLKMPTTWSIRTGIDGSFGQFRFPPPLDSYTGQIMEMTGSLTFADDLSPGSATGSVTVPAKRVTMGEDALDDTVFESIAADAHPESSFTLRQVSAPDAPLAFGQPTQMLAQGDFTMKGITVPISVMAELIPGVDEAGEPELSVTASYSINIADPFGIEGPPGPEEASNKVEFFLMFLMSGQ